MFVSDHGAPEPPYRYECLSISTVYHRESFASSNTRFDACQQYIYKIISGAGECFFPKYYFFVQSEFLQLKWGIRAVSVFLTEMTACAVIPSLISPPLRCSRMVRKEEIIYLLHCLFLFIHKPGDPAEKLNIIIASTAEQEGFPLHRVLCPRTARCWLHRRPTRSRCERYLLAITMVTVLRLSTK